VSFFFVEKLVWSAETFYKQNKLKVHMNKVLAFGFAEGSPTLRVNTVNHVSCYADNLTNFVIQNKANYSFHQSKSIDTYLNDTLQDFIHDINKHRTTFLLKDKFPIKELKYNVKYVIKSNFFANIKKIVKGIPREQIWVEAADGKSLTNYHLENMLNVNLKYVPMDMVRNLPNNSTRLILYLLARIKMGEAKEIYWKELYEFYGSSHRNGRREVIKDLDELAHAKLIYYSYEQYSKFFQFRLIYKKQSIYKKEEVIVE